MKRNKTLAAQTRIAILLAAERQFFQRGFSNTTLEMIATEAKVTRGAIYWYFSDKDEILLELAHHIRLPGFQEIHCNDKASAKEMMQSIKTAIMDWLDLLQTNASQQRLLSVILRLDGADHEKTTRYIQQSEQKADDDLAALLRLLEKMGRLAPGCRPHDMVHTVKWFVKGLCWSWLRSNQMFSLTDYASAHVSLLIDTMCHTRTERYA